MPSEKTYPESSRVLCCHARSRRKKVLIAQVRKTRRVTGTGYTNLVNHVGTHQPKEYSEAYKPSWSSTLLQRCTLRTIIYGSNTMEGNGWLRYIIINQLSFSSCSMKYVSSPLNYLSMDVETLVKYMASLTKRVDAKVVLILSPMLTIMFGGVVEHWNELYCHICHISY